MRYPFEKYFDINGFIGNYYDKGDTNPETGSTIFDKDGFVDLGDSPQRLGMFYTGLVCANPADYTGELKTMTTVLNPEDLRDGYHRRMELSYGSLGRYSRGYGATYWYDDIQRGSRDQEVARIIGMGSTGDVLSLLKWIAGHALRLFLFTYNTRENGATKENDGLVSPEGKRRSYKWKLPDVTGPSFWATEVRCVYQVLPRLLQKLVKPLLLVLLTLLDLEFLVASYLEYKKPSNDNVVENHILRLVHNNRVLPTPTILLANKFQNKQNLLSRLKAYFDRDHHPWFIYDLYEPIVNRLV